MISALICIVISVFFFERTKTNTLLEKHFYGVLFIKISSSIAVGSLYWYYYQAGDTIHYYQDGCKVVDLLLSDTKQGLQFLFSGEWNETDTLYYKHQPRALFFVRIIALPLLFAFKNYWGLSLMLALLSFWSTWYLVRSIIKHVSVPPLAVIIAFFYVPELVFWSSGVLKETLSFTFQALLVVALFSLLDRKRIIISTTTFMVCSFLLLKLKFYVFAIFVPVLVAYGLATQFNKRKAYVFLLSFCAFLVFANFTYPHLSFSSFLQVMKANMDATIRYSEEGKVTVFPLFDGTFLGLLKSVPQAITTSLFRPFIWEADGVLLQLLSFLRVDFLLGLLVALYVWNRKITFEGKVALFYVLIMAILLTISSPNYGTLSRYSISFSPFLLLVVLSPIISFLSNKRGIKTDKANTHGE